MILDATGNRAQYSGGVPLSGASLNGAPDEESTGVSPDRGAPITKDPKDVSSNITNSRLWEDTLLAVRVDRMQEGLGRKIVEQLVRDDAFANVKIIAAVSPDVDLGNDVDLIWGIFTRFDPARDVVFRETSLTGIQPNYNGPMGIDATWKPGYPDAVETSDDITRLVSERWGEYFPRR